MTSVRLLRAQDRIARPWKNGGGITQDIAVFPEGASDADFLWRASIATIAQPGPFSAYPGIDRSFLLLRGELLIEIEGRRQQPLRPGSPALLFGGEDAVYAEPVGTPCKVLNILTRRGRVSAGLGQALDPQTAGTLFLLAAEPTTVTIGDDSLDLAQDDALLTDRPCSASLLIDPALIAVCIRDQFVQ